nr:TetR family transcriptional regulator [Neorhizobium alkalisoli]
MGFPTPTEIDVSLFRERILDVAEEHFRRIGHQKTSVDDIAVHLGVSRANIYRFFPSRAAINKSVCGRFLNRTILFGGSIADVPGPARTKLVALLHALHRERRRTFMQQKPIHDLITAATNENWAVNRAHNEQLVGLTETIVSEGIEAGEFGVKDSAQAARDVVRSFMPFYHPVLIEQGARSGEDTEAGLLAQTNFIAAALSTSA